MKQLLIGFLALGAISAHASNLECKTINFLKGNVEDASSTVILEQAGDCRNTTTLSKNSQAVVEACYSDSAIFIQATDPSTGKDIAAVDASANADYVTLYPSNIQSGFLWVSCSKK